MLLLVFNTRLTDPVNLKNQRNESMSRQLNKVNITYYGPTENICTHACKHSWFSQY